MTLADLSIKRPVFAWMMMSTLIVLGIISFQRLGVSQLPDVDFPSISVNVTWEGAAPEVMETDVVDIIESALTSVQGIKEISSSVRQGSANISLDLELDRKIEDAVQEVQTKLSQAQRRLPDEMDPPIISKSNPEDQPIMWISVTGEVPLRDLMEYVQNKLQDRFSTIGGVGEVFMGGFLERNLRIWIDAAKLQEYQLTVNDVITAIQEGHGEMPAGRIETAQTEYNVRSMGEALTPEEFGNIIIPRRGGAPIHIPLFLKDVATIEDGLADVRRLSRTNGVQSVGLGIRKQRGVNEVAVSKRVLERLAEVKKEVPAGINVDLVINRSRFIEDSVKELEFTLVLSALVTSLVCWLFLGSWTATLNILMAIPTSILGTFIFIYFLGFTLNTFTLLGLSLAIGIVVDDSVMVLENIVRYREGGMEKVQAARVGARQITFAAVATTAAIIAIFLPVAFMTGVVGKFFYQYGVTITIAVAISLFEALTFTPMRCAQFLQVGARQTKFGHAIDAGFRFLAKSYHGLLTRVLRRRLLAIAASVAIFVVSLGLFAVLKKEFVPPQDQSMFTIRLRGPVGSSLEYTDEKFKKAEQFMLSRPEFLRYFSVIGGFGGGEVNSGNIIVTLKDKGDRPAVAPYNHRPSQKEITNYWREELKKIVPDMRVVMQDMSLSGFSGQRGFPVELSVRGPDWQRLGELSELLKDKMTESGTMIDVDTNYLTGVPEVRVIPDREKMSARGVSIQAVGQTINALFAGERVAKYTQGGRRYDVRVRLDAEQRKTPEDIGKLWVWNNRGELVQLKEVVSITEEKTALTISRKNRQRAVSINANIAPGKSQAEAIAAATRLAKEHLPADQGYHAIFTGSSETFKESFNSLGFVLWMGILIAYAVLASQFNSYKDPFIVLLALPFSVSGALVALWITGQSLNIYSFIGIILLMGIVKKNSIMLVDFANQQRQKGLNPEAALLEAAPIRLRPILMTSLATIAAAVPPALALGPGSELLIPMATTVIGGVIVSTAFTLVVIPCVYSLMAKFGRQKFEEPKFD